MNQATLEIIADELSRTLTGCKFGKIFQLSKLSLAIDFRLRDGDYLYVSVEPTRAARVHIVKRRLKDLEKQSSNPSAFAQFLRKRLANATLTSITKDENERVLRFAFDAPDEIEGLKNYTLIVQLTGRSANIFLLDERDFILDALRENHGDGQEIASRYAAPLAEDGETRRRGDAEVFPRGEYETLSESLDAHFQAVEAEKVFQAKAKQARAKLKGEISKREKLRRNLIQDAANHGDAEKWKRCGDLLLANLATAVREKDTVLVVDYFDDDAPTIEIEADEHASLTTAAEKYFKRYTKARNAAVEIEKRLRILDSELADLNARQFELEQAIDEKDEEFLAAIAGEKQESKVPKSKNKTDAEFTGARRYRSSDDFEILVGKAAKDNDYLTFRVAKAQDLWLHAADYGGSHVVVRNPNRLEIPTKTLIEAAELAAFFSQAKNHPKAAVHYTEKKHVYKPKGAVAGLVSLASSKTILVEPKVGLENLSKR